MINLASYNATGGRSGTPLTARILAYSDLVHWFRADADAGTYDAGVATITSRKGSTTVVQASDVVQPTLKTNQFGIYPGVDFDGTERLASTASFDAEGPFTMVWIGRSDADIGGTQAALQVRVDATNQAFIGFNGNNVRFTTGGSQTETPYTYGDVVCAIASVTGTTRKFRANGVRAADGVMSAGAGANAVIVLGALTSGSATGGLDGCMHDAMLFESDLMEDTTFISMIEAYAAALGATIAS